MSPSNSTPKAPGVRARIRAELTAAIKASARRQLATEGASSLSLRAIARELDMASSAIYRYFASRDELLTALIIDAYDAVADAVEAADAAAVDQDDLVARFCNAATALRAWAFEHPHEYALIFGSPIPGYEAPQDTIDPAGRVPFVIISLVVMARGGEHDTSPPADPALVSALSGLDGFTGSLLPTPLLSEVVSAWAQLFGMISLELFGHFKNSVADDGVYYGHAVRDMANRLLTSPAEAAT
ncbi:MAG: TetR/AcrR family transcriptional regulator [Actinomycetota bacterium]